MEWSRETYLITDSVENNSSAMNSGKRSELGMLIKEKMITQNLIFLFALLIYLYCSKQTPAETVKNKKIF